MNNGSSGAPPDPDDVVLDHLARNVETLRSHRGWSRAVVAKRSGVPASLLKHIVHLRANPAVTDVLRLADGFGVKLRDLTDRKIDPAAVPSEAGPGSYDPEHFGAAFGGRLRAYRKRRAMRLGALAVLAKIAKNTLRAAESGEVGPTTRITARIAHALGFTFSQFVESLHSSVLALATDGRVGSQRDLLFDTSVGDLLRMEELSLRRGRPIQRPASNPGATPMVYAIDGSVRIAFLGEAVELKSGDAALLASDRPYSVTVSGGTSARLLMVVRSRDIEPPED